MKPVFIHNRLRKMLSKIGIDPREVERGERTAAFYAPKLNVSEYCIHEISHYLTLNQPLKQLYKLYNDNEISSYLSEVLGKEAADFLEIRTAALTHMTGFNLNLWDDHSMYEIQLACTKNLRRFTSVREHSFQLKFEAALDDQELIDYSIILANFILSKRYLS